MKKLWLAEYWQELTDSRNIRKANMDRETKIEKDFTTFARSLGCLDLKLTSKGWPDKMFLLPGGKLIFVEFKTDVGRLSLHQRENHRAIRARGHTVWVIYGHGGTEGYKHHLKGVLEDETSID